MVKISKSEWGTQPQVVRLPSLERCRPSLMPEADLDSQTQTSPELHCIFLAVWVLPDGPDDAHPAQRETIITARNTVGLFLSIRSISILPCQFMSFSITAAEVRLPVSHPARHAMQRPAVNSSPVLASLVSPSLGSDPETTVLRSMEWLWSTSRLSASSPIS